MIFLNYVKCTKCEWTVVNKPYRGQYLCSVRTLQCSNVALVSTTWGCPRSSNCNCNWGTCIALRPLLEDRGCITESIRILVPVNRIKQRCFPIMTKWTSASHKSKPGSNNTAQSRHDHNLRCSQPNVLVNFNAVQRTCMLLLPDCHELGEKTASIIHPFYNHFTYLSPIFFCTNLTETAVSYSAVLGKATANTATNMYLPATE